MTKSSEEDAEEEDASHDFRIEGGTQIVTTNASGREMATFSAPASGGSVATPSPSTATGTYVAGQSTASVFVAWPTDFMVMAENANTIVNQSFLTRATLRDSLNAAVSRRG